MDMELYKYDNYYELLGLDSSASIDDIKKQYRKLARKYHPDAGTSANNEMFQRVSEAHEILSDPTKRKNYDISYNTHHVDDVNNESIDYFKSSFENFTQTNKYNYTAEELQKIANESFQTQKDTVISAEESKQLTLTKKTEREQFDEDMKQKNIAVNDFLKTNNLSFNEYFDYVKQQTEQQAVTAYKPAYDVIGSSECYGTSFDNWGSNYNTSSFTSDPYAINNQHTYTYDIDSFFKTDINEIKKASKSYTEAPLSADEIKSRMDEYKKATKDIDEEIKNNLKDQTKLSEIKNFLSIAYEINEQDNVFNSPSTSFK